MATRPSLRLSAAALVIALAGCGDGGRTSSGTATGAGPDAILLRIPVEGGVATAYRAGQDSALWRSRAPVPELSQLLGFDDFQGLVVGAGIDGKIIGIDLRLGGVAPVRAEALREGSTLEGSAVFGFDDGGRVLRLTTVSTWSWRAPRGVNAVVPNADGALIALSTAKGRTTVRRLIPPATRVLDSTSIPAMRHRARTPIGDRLWFDTDSGLIALNARTLQRALEIKVRDSVVAIAATPSGDRLYVATDKRRIRIVDRFAEDERAAVVLEQPVKGLRMDPDGRYLLARPEFGDSIYVVSIGTSRMIGAHAGKWRHDLPLVTPDGGILLARDEDAVLVDAESGRERMRYQGGANDHWVLIRWNGFRPRAPGLDRQVVFEETAADSAATDSALRALMAARYGDVSQAARAEPLADDSAVAAAADANVDAADAAERERERERERARESRGTWTVSFATMLVEERAIDLAARVKVDGRNARVVQSQRDGVPIWRVVLGPFASRRDAEDAGMRSKLPYWVFEGLP